MQNDQGTNTKTSRSSGKQHTNRQNIVPSNDTYTDKMQSLNDKHMDKTVPANTTHIDKVSANNTNTDKPYRYNAVVSANNTHRQNAICYSYN